MKQVIILGSPGSGKSYFGSRLCEITGIPLYHLDLLWWNPDRTHVERDVFDQRLAEIIDNDVWIIEGDYSRTYETRVRNCDTIVFLDFSVQQCLEGLKDRIGKVRDDIPFIDYEINEEMHEAVIEYPDYKRPLIMELMEKYDEKDWFVFKNREEVENWLESLERE